MSLRFNHQSRTLPGGDRVVDDGGSECDGDEGRGADDGHRNMDDVTKKEEEDQGSYGGGLSLFRVID